MGELIDMESARALVSDQVLWPRVRDFLWDFAPQVHSSWLDRLVVGSSDRPVLEMSNPRVKSWVLKELSVEPCFHAFPKDDWSRLLLLDGATLESIAGWLGALACADSLRRVTDGKVVRGLKAALPGIYPEVFGYTAYFKGFKGEDLGLKIEEGSLGEIGCLGGHILLSILDSLPAPLVMRLKLKLPKTYSDGLPPDAKLQASSSSQKSLTRLLKLKFPEAYSLCCS